MLHCSPFRDLIFLAHAKAHIFEYEGSVHCLCTAFKPLALLFIQVYQVLGEIQLEVGEVVNVVHTVLLEILEPETNQKHWRNASYDWQWHPKFALSWR